MVFTVAVWRPIFVLPTAIAEESSQIPEIAFYDQCDGKLPLGSLSQLRSAFWKVLLNDTRDPESPINIVSSTTIGKTTLVQHQAMLQKYLVLKQTKIQYLKCDFKPPYGELRKSNYIFSLQVPSLSDHQFFIVIPKNDLQKGYVYGIN